MWSKETPFRENDNAPQIDECCFERVVGIKLKMALPKFILFFIAFCSFDFVTSLTVEVAECEPPDYPQWGGYGPRQDYYLAGDFIHYYCDTDTYIGGNYYRRCEDNGDWSGDTPVCDAPAHFTSKNQTSTAEPRDENDAERAADGLRNTCSSTTGGTSEFWIGKLETPGEMIRVMIFMPKGEVSYNVSLVKENGYELSCGYRTAHIDRLDWAFHNCPGPNNRDAAYLKIRSLSSKPLQICEIMVHVLTTPTCVDPHLQIEEGRIQLSRKTASLVCNPHFTKSPTSSIDCIRDGVWSRKSLYCLEAQFETEVEKNIPNREDP